jgi:hypothetical protein
MSLRRLEISVRKKNNYLNYLLRQLNERSEIVSIIIGIHIGWHPKGDSLNTATSDFVINFFDFFISEINWLWYMLVVC